MYKQSKLFQEETRREFGGSLTYGKRKCERPLSLSLPIHLVLKLDARHKKSLYKSANDCSDLLNKFAKKFNIKIYQRAVAVDHIHLLVLIGLRENYQRFIRALTGSLSHLLKLKWLYIPYSRIVTWGREFYLVLAYVNRNQLEADGVIKFKPRKKRYRASG